MTEKEHLDGLRARSRGCPYCDGAGMARVYSPTYRGAPLESVEVVEAGGEVRRRQVPAAVNAHCLCPLGRWMRGRLSGDLLARTPDLADVLSHRSRWIHPDPTEEEERPCPSNDCSPAATTTRCSA